MKRKIAILAATLMTTSSLAVPALAGGDELKTDVQAQTQMDSGSSMDTEMNTDSAAGGASVDTQTTASTGGAPTIEDVKTSIEQASTAVDKINALTDVSSVNVVDTTTLEAEGSASADLETAMSENEEDIKQLQEALQSNAALSSELETQQVEIGDIVAAKVEADGTLTLFTNPDFGS